MGERDDRGGRRAEPGRPEIDSTAARGLLAAAGTALLDERRLLTAEELTGLAALPDGWVTSLAALAHQVRLSWCGPEVEVEGILSAKTGGCPEDCHFCSQSSRFDTPVKATPGIVIGAGCGAAFTSPNHFSTSARVRTGSMSPATTRLAFDGA